jgi:phage gp36-like protein
MGYAVAQDLIDRFGVDELNGLADRDGDGAWDTAVVTQALSDTDAEIDAALAARYSLPLATTPTVLTGVSCDITRYRLYVDAAPDRVKEAAANARRMLAAFAAGTMTLGLPAATAPVEAARVQVSAPDAIFSATEGF